MAETFSKKIQPRAHFATLALVSFITSFFVARAFTTFYPNTVLVSTGIHIHHFWFGLILLAIGGWIGISYNGVETNRFAAIIYGVGGGLIMDEVGLLLTFGNYWTGITYTFMVGFLAFIAILFLFNKYGQTILEEFAEFLTSKVSLYFGVFLAAISIAFITDTNIFLISAFSGGLAIVAVIIIIAYIAQKIRKH